MKDCTNNPRLNHKINLGHQHSGSTAALSPRSMLQHMSLVLGLLLCLILALAPARLDAQEIADNFTLPQHKTMVDLSLYDFEGAVVILDFFRPDCKYCNEQAPITQVEIEEYYDERGGNPAGVPVIVYGINLYRTIEEEETQEYMDKYDLDLVVLDQERVGINTFSDTVAWPFIVIINGTKNDPNYEQWEILYKGQRTVGDGVAHPAEWRQYIDSISGTSMLPPMIAQHPVTQTVNAGDTATFSVTPGQGTGLFYQWYEGAPGDTSVPIEGGYYSELVIENAQQNTPLWVQVYNHVGSVNSGAADLWVQGGGPSDPALQYYTGAQDLGDNWYSSAWFGDFNAAGYPWIWHNAHGYLYLYGEGGDSHLYWQDGLGVLWTSPDVYPFLYSFDLAAWLWYDVASADPRWFQNTQTGLWFDMP